MNQHKLQEWLLQQLPPLITSCEMETTDDHDELLIILHLDTTTIEAERNEQTQAEQTLIDQCRTETKDIRIQLANDINRMWGYTATWGMRAGKTVQFFTNNQKPVMTRLAYQERRILDILIAANVANTRSAALGYIVRTFAVEHQDWLEEVQGALVHVEQLRHQLQPIRRVGPPPSAVTFVSQKPDDEHFQEPPTL